MTVSSVLSVSVCVVTVTACEVFQLSCVNVSGDGDAEASEPVGTVTVTVTSAVGCEVRTAVYVSLLPSGMVNACRIDVHTGFCIYHCQWQVGGFDERVSAVIRRQVWQCSDVSGDGSGGACCAGNCEGIALYVALRDFNAACAAVNGAIDHIEWQESLQRARRCVL